MDKPQKIDTFDYENIRVAVHHANVGEGLPKHEHTFAHLTVCVQGKLVVRKEGKESERTKNDSPFILPAKEWHEIEALEDGTVFINMFPIKYDVPDATLES